MNKSIIHLIFVDIDCKKIYLIFLVWFDNKLPMDLFLLNNCQRISYVKDGLFPMSVFAFRCYTKKTKTQYYKQQ